MRPIHRVAMFAVVATLAASVTPAYASSSGKLPLGDSDLPETRTTKTLATGVTLTHIKRGDEPADPSKINTTTRGPWLVNVLTIDPAKAKGSLRSTYGDGLAKTSTVPELVKGSDAVAGVNGSFFALGADYPGDPVGFAAHKGALTSEPSKDSTEDDMVIDSTTDHLVMGKLSWSGSMTNKTTGSKIGLEYVNHPPAVPSSCSDMTDQTQCSVSGDVSRFTSDWGTSTPSGKGVEVVLDAKGCVVHKFTTRGTDLDAGQTSVQATGSDAAKLLATVKGGCEHTAVTVSNSAGDKVAMGPGVYGVNGRFALTRGGKVVVPDGSGSVFDRNPRTIAGTMSDGKIRLVTIDGRETYSVGTTMKETAAVADALGLTNSINLDGGGSTTMAVGGDVVNRPSVSTLRAVSDALVWVP